MSRAPFEIDEKLVRITAAIIGPHSAAEKAIKEAERRRANGETVRFLQARGVLIVQSIQPKDTP